MVITCCDFVVHARTGHLFVVKNRLPPEDGESPVEPLLEEEEIVRAAKRSARTHKLMP